MSVLEIRALYAAYATARVLHGVSASVAEGEVLSLLGRNGMGKTTLIRTICGLRPPSATAGDVLVDGASVLGLDSHEIARRGVVLVPQCRRVFASLSVEENLRVVARPSSAGWSVERVYDLFPRLAERKRQLGATLSGGEQQMLAIGRALMTNPKVLVMDEPSEGLAPTVRDVIVDRFRAIAGRHLAVLLAEQNVDLALALAGRVAVLGETGTIEWSGPAEQLRGDGRLLDELIGV